MRRLGLSGADVERLVANYRMMDGDDDGNLRYTAEDGDRFIRVVIAIDDIDFVITVHQRDRWP